MAPAVLGQSLDQRIALRLEPGESVSAECVSAEAAYGDRRIPASQLVVRIVPDGAGAALRVQSAQIVDEPVITVSVNIGCPTRLARQFVLFADPPAALAPSAALPQPEPEGLVPPPASLAEARAPVAASQPETAAARRPEGEPAAAVVQRARALPAPRAARQPRRAPEDTVPAPTSGAGRSRLRLDTVDEAELLQARTAAAGMAASAAAAVADAQAVARSMADAASASERRVAELERTIERMRAEARADREALLGLQQRATQASSSMLPTLLVVLVAALAALCVWLLAKLRRVHDERQLAWFTAAQAAGEAEAVLPDTVAVGTGPAAVITRPATLAREPLQAHEPQRPMAGAAPSEAPESPVERTQVLPPGWREESETWRDVSVEELIDLEQQAEFFTVLGQEDAAIDLLVDYLRSTGGGSPMPYLKLLEIYRRRDDREAYDRTRARFNHRFNAYAPDWDDDPAKGRSLEDYPSIIARLQMAWPSPIDAMAELESLLFRKSRGELFDLPAYRDVLFLYALARDLLDREPVVTGNVDVLLPISDGSEFTLPMSLEDSPALHDSGMVPLDNAPTVPVDLDVTQPSMPESLFGETATLPGSQTRRRI